MSDMLACICGEIQSIKIQCIYKSIGGHVWAIECKNCYKLVSVVTNGYGYDLTEFNAAWNAACVTDKEY